MFELSSNKRREKSFKILGFTAILNVLQLIKVISTVGLDWFVDWIEDAHYVRWYWIKKFKDG